MLARLRKFRRTLRGRSARFIGHDVCGSFSMDFPTFSVEGETPRVRLASQCPLNRTSFRSSSFSLSREKYSKSINLWHIYGDSFFFKYHPDVSLAKHFSLSLSLSFSYPTFRSPLSTFAMPLFFFLSTEKTMRRRVVVGHYPLFKYKPKHRSGQLPVQESRPFVEHSSDLKLHLSETFTRFPG